MNRLFVTFCVSFFSIFIFSQQSFNITDIEAVIEEISENSDNQPDYTTLLEDLWYYNENPIDVNSSSYEELAKLHFLTDYQIRSLLAYISTSGPITSVYEIQNIYGFNGKIARYLEHFITLNPISITHEIRPEEMLESGKHDFLVVGSKCLQEKSGFIPVSDSVLSLNPDKGRYLGNPVIQ